MKFTVDKYPSVGEESRKKDVDVLTNKTVAPISENSQGFPHGIETDDQKIWFKEESDRDRAIKDLRTAMKNAQNPDLGIMDSIKDFLKQHRNVILWLILAAALDHFLLKGAFRARIKSIVMNAVNKAAPTN